MAIVLDLDDRGRITIPKEWREKLSLNRVVAIHTKNSIYLIKSTGLLLLFYLLLHLFLF